MSIQSGLYGDVTPFRSFTKLAINSHCEEAYNESKLTDGSARPIDMSPVSLDSKHLSMFGHYKIKCDCPFLQLLKVKYICYISA